MGLDSNNGLSAALPAGRQTRYKNASAVEVIVVEQPLDHAANRRDLSIIGADVFLNEPIEAILRIVAAFLLWNRTANPCSPPSADQPVAKSNSLAVWTTSTEGFVAPRRTQATSRDYPDSTQIPRLYTSFDILQTS